MKRNNVLFNMALAAVVAAVTAIGTSYLIFRYAPLRLTEPMSIDQQRVERIVRDYLTKNPQILDEMTTELDKRQAVEEASQQTKAISDNADAIFRSPLSHVAGNPNGDVSVVEFFDYNCPFCHRALHDVVKLINDDGKVRLVLKELPILSIDRTTASIGNHVSPPRNLMLLYKLDRGQRIVLRQHRHARHFMHELGEALGCRLWYLIRVIETSMIGFAGKSSRPTKCPRPGRRSPCARTPPKSTNVWLETEVSGRLIPGGRWMAKEAKTRAELEALLMQEVKKITECGNVEGFAITRPLGRPWDIAIVGDGPHVKPGCWKKMRQIAHRLSEQYDLAPNK